MSILGKLLTLSQSVPTISVKAIVDNGTIISRLLPFRASNMISLPNLQHNILGSND